MLSNATLGGTAHWLLTDQDVEEMGMETRDGLDSKTGMKEIRTNQKWQLA